MFHVLNVKSIEGINKLADFQTLLQSHSVWCEVLPEGNSYRVQKIGRKFVTVLDKGHTRNINPEHIAGFRW